MQDERHMSKYAKKLAARQKAAEQSQRTMAAINIAMQITNGTASAPKPKKPKQQPPPPRKERNDLGDRPARLAALFREASNALHEASELADEILAMANPGLQRAEPLAISQFVVSLLPRIDGMAVRAGRILNKKAEKATKTGEQA